MKAWTFLFAAVLALGALISVGVAHGQGVTLTPIIPSGLSVPLFVTNAGDGSGRLFIVERSGAIKIFKDNQLLPTPFIDLSSIVSIDGERGVLGLAFHPRFSTNRKFYVFYTAPNGDLVVSEFSAASTSSDTADLSSQRRIIRIRHRAQDNHNGGCLQFGSDGFLYIGTGDGGGVGDPGENGQDLQSLLGKMLRLDVSRSPYRIPASNPFVGGSSGARPEIWAYGLRNPWRFSFDRPTRRLFAADVGQSSREEINLITRGANYGWDQTEGTLCYEPSTDCETEETTFPIYQYGRADGSSVIGGYVYRGSAIPSLSGKYVFGDFVAGTIWSLEKRGRRAWRREELASSGLLISSFGEDEDHELYVLDYAGGGLYRLSP